MTKSSLVETRSSSFYMTLVITLALVSVSMSKVNAHGGWGRCGSGGCGGVGWYHSPRSGRYRRRYRYSRSPMDLVQEFLETPNFTINLNSLLRQQVEKQNDESTSSQQEENTEEGESATQSTPWWSSILSQRPRYDITENPDGIIEMRMEVPGMAPQDLSVEVENDRLLRIRGLRSSSTNNIDAPAEIDDDDETSDSKVRIASPYDRHREMVLFQEVFELEDDMDTEHIEVFLSRGILTVKVPKNVKVVKHIPIVASNEDDDVDLIKAAIVTTTKQNKKKNRNRKERMTTNSEEDNRNKNNSVDDENEASGVEITDDEDDENWQ